MIFHRSNYDDIRRYYSNTIIKLPQLTDDRLWQVVHITMDEVKLVDVDGMEIYIDLEEEYEVEYPLPGRVVYQLPEGHAGLLYRKPAKQYFRGLHKDNTCLSVYTETGELIGNSWTLKNLQEFVDKPCYQDINSINIDEGFSWALTPHMVFTRSGRVKVLSTTVASASFKTKQINCLKPLFKSELVKAFPGWSFV